MLGSMLKIRLFSLLLYVQYKLAHLQIFQCEA